MTQSLLDPSALADASHTALAQTIAAILAEQHRRALGDGDVDALIEQAFIDGFTSRGEATQPWISEGLLVCPGYIKYKSATSHECAFVSLEGTWVWQAPDQVFDGVREVPGPKTLKQMLTILPVVEGMTLDRVASTSKSGGGCQMKKVISYQVRSGELVAVTTRARAAAPHGG